MNKRHNLLLMLCALLAINAVAQQGNRIYIEDFEIEPGKTVSVPLMLSNQDPTRGMQFNISLPNGLRMIDQELTAYSEEYNMNMSCNYRKADSCYLVFIYPSSAICYPADTTVALMTFKLGAKQDFRGGDIVLWKCIGSTIDNTTFVIQGDTVKVTVPEASVIEVPQNQTPAGEQYFNLNGQPISSPDSVPVAIQVNTLASGQRVSRKVSVAH